MTRNMMMMEMAEETFGVVVLVYDAQQLSIQLSSKAGLSFIDLAHLVGSKQRFKAKEGWR